LTEKGAGEEKELPRNRVNGDVSPGLRLLKRPLVISSGLEVKMPVFVP